MTLDYHFSINPASGQRIAVSDIDELCKAIRLLLALPIIYIFNVE